MKYLKKFFESSFVNDTETKIVQLEHLENSSPMKVFKSLNTANSKLPILQDLAKDPTKLEEYKKLYRIFISTDYYVFDVLQSKWKVSLSHPAASKDMSTGAIFRYPVRNYNLEELLKDPIYTFSNSITNKVKAIDRKKDELLKLKEDLIKLEREKGSFISGLFKMKKVASLKKKIDSLQSEDWTEL